MHGLGKRGNTTKNTCFNQLSRKNLLLDNKVSRSVGGSGRRWSWVSRGFQTCVGGGLCHAIAKLVPGQQYLIYCYGHVCCIANLAPHSL